MNFIDIVNKWNLDAGRTDDHFDVRGTAFHLGLQCEELAEKLEAMGLTADSIRLQNLGKSLKDGTYDDLLRINSYFEDVREALLDGDCDLIVVSIGSAQAQGADLSGALAEVIGANERKRFPDGQLHKDVNGKILKPEGWFASSLRKFLGKCK